MFNIHNMEAELAILERLASDKVQDRHGPVVKERGGVLATGSHAWTNNIGLWDIGMGTGRYRRGRWMAVPEESPAGDKLG